MRPALATESGCMAHTQCTLPAAEQRKPNAACSILFRVRPGFLRRRCTVSATWMKILFSSCQTSDRAARQKKEAARQHSEHDEQRKGLLSKEKGVFKGSATPDATSQSSLGEPSLVEQTQRWPRRGSASLAGLVQPVQLLASLFSSAPLQPLQSFRGSVPAGLRGRTVGR